MGRMLDVEPGEFSIRHGLELSAPPLPHTISVEVVRPNGRIELDPIFPRSTPLPAELRQIYRADRTLRPGEEGTAITVKVWEGEELSEPEANDWVGNVQITSDMIRRPIAENSELELFFRIDTSRLLTVEIFVPNLNQHFSEGVYLAEQEQRDQRDAAGRLMREIDLLTDRIAVVRQHVDQHPSDDAATILATVQRSVEDLDIAAMSARQENGLSDPDLTRRLVATGRDLRAQLGALERKLGVDRIMAKRSQQVQARVGEAHHNINKYGDNLDRFEFERLRKDLDAAAERLDERAVRKCVADLEQLSLNVLFKHDWFWRGIFESMDRSDGAYSNPRAAQHWLVEGDQAIRDGNGPKLREAVRKLWALQPVGSVKAAQHKVLRTGLRS